MGLASFTISPKSVHNFVLLLIFLWSLETAAAQNTTNLNSTLLPGPCNFPGYLQTNCAGDNPGVCKWSVGKRYGIPSWETPFPSDFRTLHGRSQFEWVIENSTIVVRQVFVSTESVTIAKTVQLVLRCIRNASRNNNNAKFVVSVKEKASEKLSFSCIEFIRRGLNVVSYKLASTLKDDQEYICAEHRMTLKDSPLIADRYSSLPDCPVELQGAFVVTQVYDEQRRRNCYYKEGFYGLVESDCLSKEGIYIDLNGSHNCTTPRLPYQYPVELNLHCYSEPWKGTGSYKYVIAAQRPRWRFEFRKTQMMCLKYKRIAKEEFELHIFNDPVCEQQINHSKDRAMYTLYMRRRPKRTGGRLKANTKNRCKFPNQFHGLWIEESNQNGLNRIQVDESTISIPPYGSFECEERFFHSSLPRECGFVGAMDKWFGVGRVRFYFDDYMVVSRLENGCRDRLTRLGFTNTIDDHTMVHRLSQSEPIASGRWMNDELYRHHLLKRFCTQLYIYFPDPFPYWGRNIEKVLMRPRLPNLPIQNCAEILLDIGRHNAVSKTADTNTCPSWIQFGCKTQHGSNNQSLKVTYSKECNAKNATYTCLGKTYKYGHFVLLRDSQTLRVNCAWRDKESNAIFRLDSPQCSDIDWGRWRGHAAKYTERLDIRYYEKCLPVTEIQTDKKAHNALSGSSKSQGCCLTITLAIILLSITL